MSLLGEVVEHLKSRGVDAAIIGGLALAAHGIARATLDADLLVTDDRVLDGRFWASRLPQVTVQIRTGDTDDPLAGAVRLERTAEAVDVIVGRSAWQSGALGRRILLMVAGEALPVVRRADLVLLKLFAGGPQDQLDVRLMYAADRSGLAREVDAVLADAPPGLRDAWTAIRQSSSS